MQHSINLNKVQAASAMLASAVISMGLIVWAVSALVA